MGSEGLDGSITVPSDKAAKVAIPISMPTTDDEVWVGSRASYPVWKLTNHFILSKLIVTF
jgi:hypothetical protein